MQAFKTVILKTFLSFCLILEIWLIDASLFDAEDFLSSCNVALCVLRSALDLAMQSAEQLKNGTLPKPP